MKDQEGEKAKSLCCCGDFSIHNNKMTSIYEASLFCFEIHRTRMLQTAFLVSLESSQGGGVH